MRKMGKLSFFKIRNIEDAFQLQFKVDVLGEEKYEKMKTSKNLYELHRLRKKADYKLFNPLTEKEINDSIKYMENVLNELKFENK